MPKLPRIYQNTIQKEIRNNEKVYYGKSSNKISVEKVDRFETYQEIENLIDEIFSLPTYSFNIPLQIYTENKVYQTSLIAKANGKVITFDNDIIPINQITKIEKKS